MNYYYSAITGKGRIETGNLNAHSRDDAVRQLTQDKKTVVELTQADRPKDKQPYFNGAGGFYKNKKVDQSRLFGDLTLLTGVGFTFPQALKSMKSTARNPADKAVVEAISTELNAGRTACAAFASTGLFSPHVVAMIESGDNARSLPRVFSDISKLVEQDERARSAILTALAYPALLVALMLVALAVVTFGLVPAIEPVFSNSGKANPAIIEFFSYFRVLLVNAWPWAAPVFVIGAGTIFVPAVRKRASAALSQLPLVRSIFMARGLSRYLASLGMQLEHQAPITQSLKVAGGSVANVFLQEKLLAIANSIAAGKKLPNAMEETGLFDGWTVSLVAIGYEAGRLPDALRKAAELIDIANQRRIERAVSILTPSLTILMGLIVGGLVVSVMTALLAINDLALQ